MMAKKKSLPTQLKEALNYHLFHHDIAKDAELKTLLNDLNKLDRRVAEVKREIMRNRKNREDALKQAQSFTDNLTQPENPKRTDKTS